MDTLQTLLQDLQKKIEEKDEKAVEEILEAITVERERNIIQELGKMTRELHDALNRVRFDPTLAEMVGKDIPDVKERLNYIIRMTEDAANKSIAAVERSIPLADAIKAQSEALALRTEKLLESGEVPTGLLPTLKQIKSFTEICQIDAKAIHET
jgi:chemotaxis protein CheZ